jgi:hypothetical protein
MQVDPNPAGNTQGSQQAFTPLQNSLGAAYPSRIEFMLNGNSAGAAELRFRAFGNSDATAIDMRFDTTGGTNNIYVINLNNPSATQKVFVGYWTPGVYKKVEITRNPCRNPDYLGVPGMTYVYKYDGLVIYTHSSVAHAATHLRSNWLYIQTGDTDPKIYDVDDFIIERGPPCVATCGDGFVDAPETCEPSLPPTTCPAGRCIAVGEPGGCTCQRICTLNDPCILQKGANGPYITPFDAAYGGIFLFSADAGASSIDTCGTTGYDTRIQYWGSASDPADFGSNNDDCDDNTYGYGLGADPSAPCYAIGGIASPYNSCTCWDLPDPNDTLFLAQINAGNSSARLVVNIRNKTECGLPILGGACCDGYTGFCTDGESVTETACAAISDQTTYYPNKSCAIAPACIRHTGACCDNSVKAAHCTDGTYPEDCAGANQTWVKGGSCSATPSVCPALTLGACCTTLDGFCRDDLTQAECDAQGAVLQPHFSLDRSCANLDPPCSADLGACCDHDTFGGCTDTVFADCQGGKLEWSKGASCTDINCLHEGIPTVSTWGLAVLTLLLLVGAKVYFGRRQNATA